MNQQSTTSPSRPSPLPIVATEYEAGFIEAIHFRAHVGTEEDALAIAHDYRGALYIAGEEKEKGAFDLLEALSHAGHLDARHVPVPMEWLSLEVADVLFAHLRDLPRPTIVITRCDARGEAIRVLYLGLKYDNRWSPDYGLTYAHVHGLTGFLSDPRLVDWVTAVLAVRERWPKPMLLRQLFEPASSTFTYIMADPTTKEAIIIDPVDTMVDRDLQICRDLDVSLLYAVNTHIHDDHVSGSGLLSDRVASCKSMISEASGGKADLHLKDGDIIKFGSRHVQARATPGHTRGCMSFVTDDRRWVFTGDALLVRGCGHTLHQEGGDAATLYKSVRDKIFTLPLETLVYPGHDHKGWTVTTVQEEKRWNPFLTKPIDTFLEIIASRDPPVLQPE